MNVIKRNIAVPGLLLFLLPVVVNAQGWMRTYGGPQDDGANWVEITQDSGFIICGYTGSIEGVGVVGYFLRIDSEGDTVWTKKHSPCGVVAGHLQCVQQTADNGYIALGDGIALGPKFVKYFWLIKTDEYGDTVWTSWYGGDSLLDIGHFVRQTSDRGYILTGSTTSFGAGKSDLWFLRTDSLGDTLWTRVMGTEGIDGGYGCIQDSDGNFVVAGDRDEEAWLIKFSPSGDTLWTHTYEQIYSRFLSVEETSDHGYILTGFLGTYLYLVKTDIKGDTLWTSRFSSNGKTIGRSAQETEDGGYIVTGLRDYREEGYTNYCKAWLIKTDSEGEIVWDRTYYLSGQHNSANCVRQTPDDGFIVAGRTGSSEAETTYDVWLFKTDPQGFVEGVEETDNPLGGKVTASNLGETVKINFKDRPQGFHAEVYSISGYKVDEIHQTGESGTAIWGKGQPAGVYFIREKSRIPASSFKVIILR